MTNKAKTLVDLQELIQDDLQCILDGLEDRIIENACQAVVDRIKEHVELKE